MNSIAAEQLKTLKVSIYRYDPDIGKKPYMQSMDIDIPKDKDIMVLDALQLAKEIDPTISFRRSCREGVCGSDGMNINGKNGLGCITPLSEAVRGNKLELRPLPGLPVVKDLIVDMTQFVDQYKKIQPYLITDKKTDGKEIPQTVEDRDKLDGLSEDEKNNVFNYKNFLAVISYAELDENWNQSGETTWPIYLAANCTKEHFLKYSQEEWKLKRLLKKSTKLQI